MSRAFAPVHHDQGLSRPLDHSRCFGTGFDRKGDVGSPFGISSTSMRMLDPARNARGAQAGLLPTVRSMARKDRPKREAPISYRPPERLREEFYTRVLNSGLPVSAFITAAVFGRQAPRARRLPPLEQQMLTQFLSQAARLSA